DVPQLNGTTISYVETYPRTAINAIGGLVVLTSSTLGNIGDYPGLGSGVVVATKTVGKGNLDPNVHFELFPANAQNANLLLPPASDAMDPKLLNRTAQFSPTSFVMKGGTVTVTVFIGRFANNDPKIKFADPQLQFFAGLPGYAGFQSSVTIP